MNFYIVAEEKSGVKITHFFDSPHDAVENLTANFLSSLDDSGNTGTVFSIQEADTNEKP